ncbi:DciA family protein [Thiohalobacter sp.]|uniref:DciA family protein n=1 Tax=Thiohalobacter sp. TaxID=2025948 RepID=UPI0026271670|nr:DciA family protein [Thiohalobacter sp.]
MSSRGPVSIGRFLEPVGKTGFARLADRSRRLMRLGRAIEALLPLEFSGRVRVGNLSSKQLILFVESPEWSARLRFHLGDLKRRLAREHGLEVAQVGVRVLPPERPQPRRGRPRLGDEAARALEGTATSIGDEKLAAALRRLARHARPKTP